MYDNPGLNTEAIKRSVPSQMTVEDSKFNQLLSRLEDLTDEIRRMTSNTNHNMDKLLGSEPYDEETAGKCTSEPNGLMENLEQKIELLAYAINENREASLRIERVV